MSIQIDTLPCLNIIVKYLLLVTHFTKLLNKLDGKVNTKVNLTKMET